MQYYTLIFLPKENNIFRKFNILFISTLIKFTNKNYQNRYMSEEDHRVTFHMYSLTFAWFFLSTIALWGIAFKHTKIGFYLHAICYGLAGLITISAVPLVIFKSGLDLRLIPDNIPYVYHNIAGFSTLCLIIFVMCFGAATKLNQMTPKTPTSQIRTVSLIHKILGSLILITSRIALYTQWSSNDPLIFKGMVGVDAISFGGLFLKKVFPKTV